MENESLKGEQVHVGLACAAVTALSLFTSLPLLACTQHLQTIGTVTNCGLVSFRSVRA